MSSRSGIPDLYAGLVAESAPLTFGEPVEETALIGPGRRITSRGVADVDAQDG